MNSKNSEIVRTESIRMCLCIHVAYTYEQNYNNAKFNMHTPGYVSHILKLTNEHHKVHNCPGARAGQRRGQALAELAERNTGHQAATSGDRYTDSHQAASGDRHTVTKRLHLDR
jgi:hypothetical protein